MTRRNVLIVLAHPEPGSFSAAMAAAAATALEAAGHRVTLSDLCAQGFRADAGRHDFTTIADPARFHYQTEQEHAARNGGFCAEIAREQARVAEADLLILQFPLWWGGPPAMLKGWLERVLAYGFAYVDGARFDSGLFRGRHALIGVTTGGTPQRFSEAGVYGPIGQVLYPLRRLALEYMGLRGGGPLRCLCRAAGRSRPSGRTILPPSPPRRCGWRPCRSGGDRTPRTCWRGCRKPPGRSSADGLAPADTLATRQRRPIYLSGIFSPWDAPHGCIVIKMALTVFRQTRCVASSNEACSCD